MFFMFGRRPVGKRLTDSSESTIKMIATTKASVKLITRCLVPVKIYGNNPHNIS